MNFLTILHQKISSYFSKKFSKKIPFPDEMPAKSTELVKKMEEPEYSSDDESTVLNEDDNDDVNTTEKINTIIIESDEIRNSSKIFKIKTKCIANPIVSSTKQNHAPMGRTYTTGHFDQAQTYYCAFYSIIRLFIKYIEKIIIEIVWHFSTNKQLNCATLKKRTTQKTTQKPSEKIQESNQKYHQYMVHIKSHLFHFLLNYLVKKLKAKNTLGTYAHLVFEEIISMVRTTTNCENFFDKYSNYLNSYNSSDEDSLEYQIRNELIFNIFERIQPFFVKNLVIIRRKFEHQGNLFTDHLKFFYDCGITHHILQYFMKGESESTHYVVIMQNSSGTFTIKNSWKESEHITHARDYEALCILINTTLKGNSNEGFQLFCLASTNLNKLHQLFTPKKADGNPYNNIAGYFGKVDENDDKTGEGMMPYSNGESYNGTFKKDKYNGFGVYHYHDGSVYEGNFENNVKSGQGTYTWPNGDVYIGNFENDAENGFGIYRHKIGGFYKGHFKNELKHGKGILEDANGNLYDGVFEDDKIMHGTYTDVNGIVLQIENGKFISHIASASKSSMTASKSSTTASKSSMSASKSSMSAGKTKKQQKNNKKTTTRNNLMNI